MKLANTLTENNTQLHYCEKCGKIIPEEGLCEECRSSSEDHESDVDESWESVSK